MAAVSVFVREKEGETHAMHRPEMILFDYGCTLLNEPSIDFLRGEAAVFPYVRDNPLGKTPKELCEAGLAIFRQLKNCRHMGFEITEKQMMQLKYDTFGVTFSIPLEEVESILWDHASPGGRMQGIEPLLAQLAEMGIRTGVISNLGWSGAALRRRIDRLLPNHCFEFVLVSSEYGFRKPHEAMFRIALQRAGLPPDRVWFCGDSAAADVCGAHGAGLFPVLYEGEAEDGERSPYLEANRQIPLDFDHLHVHHWRELGKLLREL